MDFAALRNRMRAEMTSNSVQNSSEYSPALGPSVKVSAQTFTDCIVNFNAAARDLTDIQRCRLAVGSVSAEGEKALMDIIRHGTRWVELSNRRLQEYGGKPSSEGLVDAEPLPPWLDRLAGELVSQGIFPPHARPNHVLVNEYAMDEGILPHTDGPAYFPMVATLSLGSPALMVYDEGIRCWEERQARGESGARRRLEVVLHPRSCVITSGELYANWLHSIPAEEESVLTSACINGQAGDTVMRTGTRLSITIRHVPGVSRHQSTDVPAAVY